MSEKIKKFILNYKLLSAPDYDLLSNKIIKSTPKLSLKHDNLILSFILSKPLEPKIFFSLIEQSKKISEIKFEFMFEIENNNFNEKDICKYFSYYFENVIKQKRAFLKIINRQNFCFINDNIVFLRLKNVMEKDCFVNYLHTLTNILHTAGFDKKLSIKIDVLPKDTEIQLNRERTKKKYLNEINETREKNNLNNQKNKFSSSKNSFFDKKLLKKKSTLISNITNEESSLIIQGQVFSLKEKNVTNGVIYEFGVTDYSDSIFATVFIKDESFLEELSFIKINDWIKAECSIIKNKYKNNELTANVKKIIKIDPPKEYVRIDNAKVKRIEFSFHSKMTAFDGITDPIQYLKFANDMNWTYAAITDIENVQAYPEIMKSANKIIPIYGLDCEVIDDEIPIIINERDELLNNSSFVIFDLETSGLFPYYDDIIEFGGIKVKNNKIVDTINFFIKPKQPISDKISSITKISNEMLVNDGLTIKDALKKIVKWIGDSVIVAHNGIDFDFCFLQTKLMQNNMPLLQNPMLDTLRISWAINSDMTYHGLGYIARKLKIEYNESTVHRANVDAEILYEIFKVLINRLNNEFKIKNLNQINKTLQNNSLRAKVRGNRILIYAKNENGIKAIYKLVSQSLTDNFLKGPRLYWKDLKKYRENLLISSNPNEGEIFKHSLYNSYYDSINIFKKFDFVLISPANWNQHLINFNNLSLKNIEDTIKRIIDNAKNCNKLVVATSDAYYLHPWEKKYHEIMICTKALGGKRHRFYNKNESVQNGPNAYVRTTNEMLEEFSFLKDESLINDIVCNNGYKIIKQFNIQKSKPIKTGLYAPKLNDADFQLETLTWENAKKLYGDKLPSLIKERIKIELNSILNNGFGIIYWIAHLLIEKSNNAGFLVGSRGSVGSSLVANLIGISEINPLPSHYLCLKCKYIEFVPEVDDGFDLPEKKCNHCNILMQGDGHDIPFATFMGIEGDKVPDIDLNFSGEYQSEAHKHIRDLFGKEHTLRAGTISTIAEKTAFNIVRTYFDEMGLNENLKQAEIERYAKSIIGIKRTTGQHPGGIMVFPKEYELTDFTPYNYPADDVKSDWKTTHFTFDYLHDSILKLDILGHDDPSMLKMLCDLTGIDPIKIPHHDDQVMNLFSGLDSLKISSDALLGEKTGALGIPEFGTDFVRRMLVETKPKTFADLIRISGLSHGTDVWTNNAQNLIKKGLTLREVIACRDDIMIFLQKYNISTKESFQIMETVRKGKKLTNEMISLMQSKKIPEWYIDSCKQIKYMFPKAHAAAYVLMAWRIAWFKIYKPLEYYTTLFSIKVVEHDIPTCLAGKENVRQALQNIRQRLSNIKTKQDVKDKEKELIGTYELYMEMLARGFKMSNISLENSLATKFRIIDNKIVPPFTTIAGLGPAAAESIINARNDRPFTSIDDLSKRAKLLTKTNLNSLRENNVLNDIRDNDLIKLF